MSAQVRDRGPVKFILLHHEGCPRDAFHFCVGTDGAVVARLPEADFAQHPGVIAVVLEGHFDETAPRAQQIEGLKRLLVDLALRYPSAKVGAHRQVRGDRKTTCPGRRFPMRELAQWCEDGLLRLRDERIHRTVEEQYSKL